MSTFPGFKSNHSLQLLNEIIGEVKQNVRIGVVYAGNPDTPGVVSERTGNPRSWKSYRDVAVQIAEALKHSGFLSVELVEEGPEFNIAIASKSFQLFWLNSAGIQGRGSTAHAAACLESQGYSYLGHTPLQAALLDDKVLMKQWLRGVGLPTAPFIVRAGGSRETVAFDHPDYAQEFGVTFAGPYLVKPASGRGSVLVEVVDNINNLQTAIQRINAVTGDRVIIEQFLPGQEYCVWASRGSVVTSGLVTKQHSFLTFGHAERLFLDKDRIFRKEERSDACPDLCRQLTSNDERLREDLTYMARSILNGLHLALPIRIDARLSADGLLQILEVNPKPDLKRPVSEQSGLLGAGLADLNSSYEDFIVKILADWLDFHLQFSPSALSMLLKQARVLPPALAVSDLVALSQAQAQEVH